MERRHRLVEDKIELKLRIRRRLVELAFLVPKPRRLVSKSDSPPSPSRLSPLRPHLFYLHRYISHPTPIFFLFSSFCWTSSLAATSTRRHLNLPPSP